jgi:hypothetical protein
MTENFKLPSNDEFETLCDYLRKDLKLDSDQLRELALVIHRTHAKIEGVIRSSIGAEGRKRVMTSLDALDTALSELMSSLDVDPGDLSKFDDAELLGLINTKASGSLTQALAGRRIADVLRDNQYPLSAFYALTFVPKLIAFKKEVDLLLDQSITDTGGRDRDLARTYLVLALIEASMRIIGSPAAGTEDGRFVNLVSHVFDCCDLPESGVKNVIERTLSAMKGAK